MAIRILFDDKELSSQAIMSLSQSGQLFDSTFKLGSTLCRSVKLEVNSRYVSLPRPNVVYIYDDDVIKFTLYIDNVEKIDDFTYSYTLCDSMVKLNVALSDVFDWDTSTSYTVQTIVDNICDYIGSSHVTVDYIGDLSVSWDWDTMARDFLSYVAEINASYVYINASGNVTFVEHKNAPSHTLDVETCEDISIGEYHCIQRVGYEQASASIYYPTTEVDYNTVYINQDNILITDSGDFTREGIIQHIYEKINGFEFYCMSTSKCEIYQDCIAGDIINTSVINDKFLASAKGQILANTLGQKLIARIKTSIPTIAQIDWAYNAKWNGGYDLDVDTEIQCDTSIDTVTQYAKSIKIRVDRELNKITQSVSNLESTVREIAANDVDTVVVQYAQIQGELQPQAWGEEVTWNDEYKTYYRAKVTYIDTSEYYTNSWLLEKEDGKTVATVESLYQTLPSGTTTVAPDNVITDNNDKPLIWTKKCPTYKEEYPTYAICVQIGYTDGSYSWSDVRIVSAQSSLEKLTNRVKVVESNISTITQTENEISATVKQITDTEIPGLDTRTSILETCVQLQADGLKISQGTDGAYTKITDDGMEIYSEANLVAYTKKSGFYAIDYIMNGWHMVTANNKNSFCIVRKEYN